MADGVFLGLVDLGIAFDVHDVGERPSTPWEGARFVLLVGDSFVVPDTAVLTDLHTSEWCSSCGRLCVVLVGFDLCPVLGEHTEAAELPLVGLSLVFVYHVPFNIR